MRFDLAGLLTVLTGPTLLANVGGHPYWLLQSTQSEFHWLPWKFTNFNIPTGFWKEMANQRDFWRNYAVDTSSDTIQTPIDVPLEVLYKANKQAVRSYGGLSRFHSPRSHL